MEIKAVNVLAVCYKLNYNIILNIHAIINNKINKIHISIIILYIIYMYKALYKLNKIYFTSYNIIYNNYISNIIRKLNIYIWLIHESNLL